VNIMRIDYVFKKIRDHITKGTLVSTLIKRTLRIEPVTKIINTLPYNSIYRRVVDREIIKFSRSPLSKSVSINIENTNACNANCIMCPRELMTRRIGYMDMELFKKIIDDIKKSNLSVKNICLNGFGEPLLDPLLPERIEYIKRELGCDVIFFTNGSLLCGEMAVQILNSGIDEINISLNGLGKEYERIMGGLSYKKISDNVKNFMKKRGELGLERPFVYISCVYIHKDFNKKQFLDEWKDIVDSIFITPAEKWSDSEDDIPYEELPYKFKEWPCKRLWENIWIAWDGKVHLCCKDYDGKMIMGDLKRESLSDIWFGNKFQNIRKLHQKNKFEQIPLCKGCGNLVDNSIQWW